jgi:hypothetical protein
VRVSLAPSSAPWSTATSRAAIAMFAWLGVLACAGNEVTGPPTPKPVASIIVSPGEDTLVALGRTRSFVAVARDADGVALPGTILRWSSSDTLIARVDSVSGVVTAVGNGMATIQARSGIVVGSGTVAVIQIIAAVTVTPGNVALAAIGATQAYTAVARDSANAIVTGVRFLWGSSDPSVALVDTLGVATVVGAGATTISATGRGVPAYSTLSVTQDATTLEFSVEPTNIVAGDIFATAIEVEVRDANGAVVRGARIPVTLNQLTPGSALRGSTTVMSVDGIATFSGLTIERANTLNYLSAVSGSLDGDTSATFAVAAGPRHRATLIADPVLSEIVGAREGTLRVQALDRFGNRVAGSYFSQFEAVGDNGLATSVYFSTNSPGNIGERIFADVWLNRPVGPLQLRVLATYVGDTTLVSEPIDLTARAPFESLSLGDFHACGVVAGRALCWGSNINEELGYTTAAGEDSVPTLAVFNQPPGAMLQVAAMDSRTCALAATGAVHCWGFFAPSPVAGTGVGGLQFVQITSSERHMCGLVASGAAYCWGTGTDGQLGNGGFASSPDVPVQVTGSGSGPLVFTSIDAGGDFTCALTAIGAAYCWGRNSSGQLGDSTTTARNVPTLVAGTGSGSRVLTELSAGGESYSCAVNTLGQMLCWGTGRMGVGLTLSDAGASVQRLVPTQSLTSAAVVSGPWQSVSIGFRHGCAVNAGTLYCWGEHHAIPGEFTGSPLEARPIVVSVAGRSVLSVTSGSANTCARNVNGVYCWGLNRFGLLGIGSTAVSKVVVPTRVVQ